MADPRLSVFVVDDSAVSRLALSRIVQSEPGLRLAGEARNGKEALKRIPAARPDLVLMDIVMPVVDGLEATQRLMETHPVPILLISDLVGQRADLNFEALRAGAVDLLRKPTREQITRTDYHQRLVRKIRGVAKVPVVKRRFGSRTTSTPRPSTQPVEPARPFARVVIGASTGGPVALAKVLQAVAPKPPWPILVVQHIASGFVEGMSRWLAATTGCTVEIAQGATRPEAGVVYVAPDDHHLVLTGRTLDLRREPTGLAHQPSVDVLFDSVVQAGLGSHTLGVLLTGMGRDGAQGLLHLRQAGAWTMVQDESTSVVFGMPGAALQLNAACEVLPVDVIGERLLRLSRSRHSPSHLQVTASSYPTERS